ncbi:MAG: hypothetical protein ABSB91_03520 [Sedimentisphaerales bacterium]|jgi:hypothetical protein
MDNFWLKVVIAIAVIAGLVYGANWALNSVMKQTVPEKTIGDQWREDEKRLRAEPNIPPSPNAAPAQAGNPQQPAVEEAPKFKELTEDEQAGAEQLFEWAIKCREMARLPGTGGYGKMVKSCRDIIERYPRSKFDYQARRMLGEVPKDQWERYNITQEEINGPKQ